MFISNAILVRASRLWIRHHWFIPQHPTTTFTLTNSTPSQPHRTTLPGPSPLLRDVGPIDNTPSKYRKTVLATPVLSLSRGMWAAHHHLMEELGKEQYKGGPKRWEAYVVCHEKKPWCHWPPVCPVPMFQSSTPAYQIIHDQATHTVAMWTTLTWVQWRQIRPNDSEGGHHYSELSPTMLNSTQQQQTLTNLPPAACSPEGCDVGRSLFSMEGSAMGKKQGGAQEVGGPAGV